MAKEMSSKVITAEGENYPELILSPEYYNISKQKCKKQLETTRYLPDTRAGINLIKTITGGPNLLQEGKHEFKICTVRHTTLT